MQALLGTTVALSLCDMAAIAVVWSVATAIMAEGALRVGMAAGKHGCYLVHVSCGAVFSGARTHYVETSLPDPVTPYGAVKAAAETGIRSVHIPLSAGTGLARDPQVLASGGDQGAPAFASGSFAVEPVCWCGRLVGKFAHEGGEFCVVRVVAVVGEGAQSADRVVQVLGVLDGVVEGEGEFEGDLHGGQSSDADLGAQDLGPFFHAGGAGVAQESCDVDGEGGGAQVEAVQEVAGEGDFVVGLVGVGDGLRGSVSWTSSSERQWRRCGDLVVDADG